MGDGIAHGTRPPRTTVYMPFQTQLEGEAPWSWHMPVTPWGEGGGTVCTHLPGRIPTTTPEEALRVPGWAAGVQAGPPAPSLQGLARRMTGGRALGLALVGAPCQLTACMQTGPACSHLRSAVSVPDVTQSHHRRVKPGTHRAEHSQATHLSATELGPEPEGQKELTGCPASVPSGRADSQRRTRGPSRSGSPPS